MCVSENDEFCCNIPYGYDNIVNILRVVVIQRASGYSFYIYDTPDTFDALSPVQKNLIYRHDPLSGCPSSFQNITVNRLGVEIIFTNQRPEGYVSSCNGDEMTRTGVELCEVRVMGEI